MRLYIDYNGYYVLNHHKQYIKLHRLIMEQHLGRKLKREEHIHHKNGDRLDNRITNMKIVTNSKHISDHRRKHQPSKHHDLNYLKESLLNGMTKRQIAKECGVSEACIGSFVGRYINNPDCKTWAEYYERRKNNKG